MKSPMPREVTEYIEIVRSGEFQVCEDLLLFCELVEKVWESEDVRFDEEQLAKYMDLQKYFPYRLFPWEKALFALHNTLYKADGQLRFPTLVAYVGRGTGKNGYLSFEDFALLTPVNGVQRYDIYTFAMAETQAKTSWQDVYDILEADPQRMKKHFYWTKEVITCKKTGSSWYYCTSNPKTKDGARPGKVDHDEYHAYENYRLIDTGVTGLGKKPHPRRTIITTDGLVRGGPLDDLKEKARKILTGEIPDNGTLTFMCHIESEAEIHDKAAWHKANPSLRYFPHLQNELEIEYADYVQNPAANVSFAAKRMNFPPGELECSVTSWENLLATNQDYADIYGLPSVAGIDYASTTDFVAAGLLFRKDGKDYWYTHTWVCRRSKDLYRIKAPLEQWEAAGLLTFVDAPEIPPELPVVWLKNEAAKHGSKILKVGIDKYRYTLLAKALREYYFSAEKDFGNVVLLRPSNEMMIIPSITSGFVNHTFVWGDNPLMRWYANNSKTEVSSAGNMTYGKIEPKSRKTDGFKAFVAAECVSEALDASAEATDALMSQYDVCVY